MRSSFRKAQHLHISAELATPVPPYCIPHATYDNLAGNLPQCTFKARQFP